MREGLLEGTSAFITGAGSGIGRGVALRLAALGAHVTGMGRREDPLAETAALAAESRGEFDYVIGDVRDFEAATAALTRVGEERGLHLLVNNAGGQFVAPTAEISMNGWKSVIELNLNSIFNLTKAAHPFLADTHGAVVNISLSGVERGGMGVAHSIAARSGVLGLTRTLALEWAPAGIRLNCLGPGTVVTAAMDSYEAAHVENNLIARATPMHRATSVAEVAELVAFLASPAGAMMTGQLVQIDGGAHLGMGVHMLPEYYA